MENPIVVIDPHTITAKKGDQELDLTLVELRLLAYFMKHAGRVISIPELHEKVWSGRDAKIHTNIVTVYINYLRQKIGAEMITTHRGEGYQFNQAA